MNREEFEKLNSRVCQEVSDLHKREGYRSLLLVGLMPDGSITIARGGSNWIDVIGLAGFAEAAAKDAIINHNDLVTSPEVH